MVGLRFADMQLRPAEFLDFTSLTVEEFQLLTLNAIFGMGRQRSSLCLCGIGARTRKCGASYHLLKRVHQRPHNTAARKGFATAV
jgi:hypothetical protein